MMWSHLGDVLSVLASGLLFVAYVFVVFQIVADLARNPQMSGGKKAIWVIGLIFIPLLTAILYFVLHGRAMAARQRAVAQRAESYLEHIGGASSVDQLTRAKALLDQGMITPDEFSTLKQQVLGARLAPA
jgi:uncharacterized membrane protein